MTIFRKLIARFMHGTCPCCGAAITYSCNNGSTYCPKCKKQIVIRDGRPSGWR